MKLCLLSTYLNLLHSAGFNSEINQPTRGDACLDHLMIKSVHKNLNKQISINFEVPEHQVTDHATILFTIEHKLALGGTECSDDTSYTIIDKNILKNKLRSMDWGSLLAYTVNNENKIKNMSE